MSSPKGFPTQEKEIRVGAQFATVEPVGQAQYGMSVLAHTYHTVIGSDATEAVADPQVALYRIKATAHAAQKGDLIRFTSGTFSGREIRVHQKVDADNFDLVESLDSAPIVGTTFDILRNKAPIVDTSGAVITTASAVTAFKLNGTTTEVSKDTVTPANSIPLPVEITGASGVVNISAGNLYVHTDHTGADYDSMRIGDGTNLLAVDSNGAIKITAASLPLATDAATATKQDTGNNSLSSIDGKLVQLVSTVNGLKVDGSAVTQPISATSLPLPGGASTLGEQQTQTTKLGDINTNVTNGVAVPGNTTSTPLGIGGVFTGSWTELTLFNSFSVGIFSDVNSATDGVDIQYSADGITPHHHHYYTFSGGVNGTAYNFTSEYKYFRVVYTNNTVAQTSFQLITFLKRNPLFPSSYRLKTTFTDESQVLLTKSAITGKTTSGGGGYVDVKVSPSGALTVDATIPYLSVVDLQDTPVLDAASTNIPASSSNSLQVVASLAAQVRKIQILDTTGGFIGVYSGAVSSPTLMFIVGPGSDQTIEHSIAAGTLISIRSMTTSAITSGNFAMNFMG